MSSQWFKDVVVYQIYPQSFQDSNGDGIGDLNGIKKRIPYLKKLGVDVVWLTPIYSSPGVDNGYDISDYLKINPQFGTMDDFDGLLTALHKNGLKLLMDLVVNHTSDQHKWFRESKKSRNNPYSDYYIWKDPVDGHRPNNWGATFGGSVWTYVPQRKQYYLHLFVPQQPDLNWKNPKLRKNLYKMMRFWLDKGIDGFRMDSIGAISKPDGLPNAPQVKGAKYGNTFAVTLNGSHLEKYLKEMNREVLSHYDIMTVGEMSGTTTQEANRFASLNGRELNMIFQFEHVNLAANPDTRLGKWNDQPISLVQLKEILSRWENQLHGKGWNSLYWNNHDQPRAVSRFTCDDPKYRLRAAKMLGTTLHMLEGTPYIFEGEELGIPNVHFKKLKEYEDVESINAYHDFAEDQKLVSSAKMLSYLSHMSRDNTRTPMQWDNSKNDGFTTGQPWFKVSPNYPNYEKINVQNALKDPDSVFYYYHKLIQLRHQYKIIRWGSYEELDPKDNEVFAYKRHYQDENLLVINNFTKKNLWRDYQQRKAQKLLLSNYQDDQLEKIRPYESKVYLL